MNGMLIPALLGILAFSASISFMLPQKAPLGIRAPQAIIYLYISAATMLETQTGDPLWTILAFASIAILISNVSYFEITQKQKRMLRDMGISLKRKED
jgi:hypothetical protein